MQFASIFNVWISVEQGCQSQKTANGIFPILFGFQTPYILIFIVRLCQIKKHFQNPEQVHIIHYCYQKWACIWRQFINSQYSSVWIVMNMSSHLDNETSEISKWDFASTRQFESWMLWRSYMSIWRAINRSDWSQQNAARCLIDYHAWNLRFCRIQNFLQDRDVEYLSNKKAVNHRKRLTEYFHFCKFCLAFKLLTF